MISLRKILGSLLITMILMVNFAPTVMAQSVLDDIKGKLESEGIAVVDYSTPQGAWGSLPKGWVSYLANEDYSNLQDVAADLKSHFIGSDSLADLRGQHAIAVAEKSRLTIASEISDKSDAIEELEDFIKGIEEDAKDDIAGIVSGAEAPLDKEEGINLIFAEVDFYYNYSKWGRIPLRIIGVLEGETDYKSLQDMLDLNDLSTPEGMTKLTDELSTIEGLSGGDVELIVDSTLILLTAGEGELHQVGRAVVNVIKNLAGALAVIWIIIAGARMIFAQGEESVITDQKRAITYGVIGLAAILLVDRMVDVLYGAPGVVRTELVQDAGFSQEVYGVITFVKSLVGIVAILFIIVSGVRMLFAQGAEDEITKQRQSILYVGIGLVLIAVDKIIVENFFIIPTQNSDQIKSSNITSIVNVFGTVLQFVLGFVGLVAFGALVYGGATMIMNYGNDEMVENSKKIIKHAVIGIVVILSAYTLVASLVVFR